MRLLHHTYPNNVTVFKPVPLRLNPRNVLRLLPTVTRCSEALVGKFRVSRIRVHVTPLIFAILPTVR
jgi:hypothetical protein